MSGENPSSNVVRKRPSTDPGWSYGQPVEEGNNEVVKCDFCGHISRGGIKRFKHHLVGNYKSFKIPGVKKCTKAPIVVKDEIYDYMISKAAVSEEKKQKKEKNVAVNIYADEVEEIEGHSSLMVKKMKGPLDGFLAPIDGGFTPKVPTSALNKKALEVAHSYIADFFYENGISFNCANSESYIKMCRAIVQYSDPTTFKPPTYRALRVDILKKKVDETRQWLNDFKKYWEIYGVTIMTDWWTDGKRRTLINFLVNCPKGTVFLKSLDGSEHVKDATLIYNMLKEVINEVGPKNVIQVVTDNGSNYKLAGKWLMEDTKIYWTPCAAHCINLMLEDVSKLPVVMDIMERAKKMTKFIYNHCKVLHLLRKFTEGRDLVRPAVTRFATSFLSLQSIFELKLKIRNMFNSEEWRKSKWAKKHAIGKEVTKYVKRSTYWNDMHYVLKIMAPMVDVIRLVDTEEKPSMGYIYKAMDICKEKVCANLAAKSPEDEDMWRTLSRIMDKRWSDQLQQPLHAAAHYLNPQMYWATPTSPEEIEADMVIKEGLFECISKLVELEEESKILEELVPYRTRRGRLGKANAIASIQSLAPVEWWITFGSETPNLQKFAKRILGLTSSASPCERNWSAFNNLHTKKRNRLDHAKLNDLVYVQYNKRLRKRFEERLMGSEVDPIELKTLDECSEWLDPHEARDDPVEGTDFNFGTLEDAEGSENDEHPPPVTRQQTYQRRRTRTNATSEPTSTSRAAITSSRTSSRARSSQVQLEESETDDDDDDDDAVYTTDDEDFNDGISSGDEEDIWGNQEWHRL